MQLTQEQYDRIKHLLPVQRGNVKIDNLTFLNALIYMCENGVKWRRMPEHFGHWHTIYMRFSRWTEKGVMLRVFQAFEEVLMVDIDLSVLSLDSTCVKVHPDGTGALKKTARSRSAKRVAAGTRKSTPSSPTRNSSSR